MGVYQRLGVQPVINARGMNTMASGSLMPQAVLDAIAEAGPEYIGRLISGLNDPQFTIVVRDALRPVLGAHPAFREATS